MKEDSEICAFVIIIFKTASRGPNFGGKKWHPLFFTKSWSKNNFQPKNQFQQANATGSQNLTLCPLLIPTENKRQLDVAVDIVAVLSHVTFKVKFMIPNGKIISWNIITLLEILAL